MKLPKNFKPLTSYVLVFSLILNIIFAIRVIKNRRYFAEKSRIHQEMIKKDAERRNLIQLAAERLKKNTISRREITLPIDRNDIIFIGNSITEGFPLSELFRSVNVKNRGIGGENSFDVLYRIEKVIKAQPKKLFIMIGINDIHQGLPMDTTLKNIEQILAFSKHANIKTYIHSILPTQDSSINYRIKKYNKSISHISRRMGIEYINLYPKFEFQGRLNEEFTYDGLHLSTKGYQLWKNVIYQEVVK